MDQGRRWVAVVAALAALLGVAGVVWLAHGLGTPAREASTAAPRPQATATATPDVVPPTTSVPEPARRRGPPNIVVVLMDDFSMDLLQTMESADVMSRRGASYENSFVVDSLCCVSRSSFFTGQYPHQTGVLTNTSNRGLSTLGGWPAFVTNGNEERSFNVRLQDAGYHTAFVGKYLNEYEWVPGRDVPPAPPGWSTFNAVFGSAYDGWDFASTFLLDGGLEVVEHPAPPADASGEEKDAAYAGQVIENLALDVVRAGESSRTPYFLEVAPYAPHNRTLPEGHYPGDPLFPPAFRDRRGEQCGRIACERLDAGELPGLDQVVDTVPRNEDGSLAREWNTGVPLPADLAVRDLRNRARMAQSIDRMVLRILEEAGDNTYVVLTSDNGFHLGQLGLGRGKGTAYATDAQVPLLVVGPDVEAGVRREVVSNLDLAPTFEDLAGLDPAPYRSGRSLVPTLRDSSLDRRRYAFMEHTQQTLAGGVDPDAPFTGGELDRIPSWTAVRTRDALLVRLDLDPGPLTTSWGYEFYSYAEDRFERTNAFADPRHRAQVQTLMRKLAAFDGCATAVGDDSVSRECRRLTR